MAAGEVVVNKGVGAEHAVMPEAVHAEAEGGLCAIFRAADAALCKSEQVVGIVQGYPLASDAAASVSGALLRKVPARARRAAA